MSEFVNDTLCIYISDKKYRRLSLLDNEEWKCICSGNNELEFLLMWKACILKQRQPQIIRELAVHTWAVRQEDGYTLNCEPAVLLGSVKKKDAETISGIIGNEEDWEQTDCRSMMHLIEMKLGQWTLQEFVDMMRLWKMDYNPVESVEEDSRRIFLKMLLLPEMPGVAGKEINASFPTVDFSLDRLRDAMLLLYDDKEAETIYTVEELEGWFAKKFQVPAETLRPAFLFLLSEKFLSHDYVENNGTISHTIIPGERFSIFYTREPILFVAALEIFCRRVQQEPSAEKPERRYRMFISRFHYFLEETSLLGTYLSEEKFQFLAQYFQNDPIGKARAEEATAESMQRPYYIQMAEEFAKKVKI